MPNATARTLIAMIVVSVLLAGRSASGDTRVVFTVDVESNETFGLPDQIDAVCKGGSACGLMEIARRLDERRWAGTFFLDVYEHRKWGQAAMRNIAVGLQAAGQDVALHTHPQWAYDPSRPSMYQYSLDEQTSIVRDGVRLLEAWTGRPVVAHRAGAYAADESTLIALERNGVLLDSSLFWKYPDNRLGALGLPRNLPAWHGHLAEVPVTVYLREERPTSLGAAFAPVTAVSKIDPNWFINENEVRAVIDAAVAADLPVLVVFLHSFSFMGDGTSHAPLADRHSMDMFRAVLDHVASKNLAVVTMREIANRGLAPPLPRDKDVIPRVAVDVDLPHYAWRRVKVSRKTDLRLAAGLTVLFAAAMLFLARRRRPNQNGGGERAAGFQSPRGSGGPTA
jgi:peptidoglycan/xylan/chitin deacetylase (PgdA/CDA1 family)